MSVDRSLRTQNALVRHRNVLTRAERIEILKDKRGWEDDKGALHLPKVSHRKGKPGGKAKDKKGAGEEAEAEK